MGDGYRETAAGAPPKKEPVLFGSEAAAAYFAGLVSGAAETVFSHPVETAKVRLQTRLPPLSYSPWSLYDGLWPALGRGFIGGAVFLGTNTSFRKLFGAEEEHYLAAPWLAAAAMTGVAETVAYCPIELIKIQQQVNRIRQKSFLLLPAPHTVYCRQTRFTLCATTGKVGNHSRSMAGAMNCAKYLAQHKDGGFFKGLHLGFNPFLACQVCSTFSRVVVLTKSRKKQKLFSCRLSSRRSYHRQFSERLVVDCRLLLPDCPPLFSRVF